MMKRMVVEIQELQKVDGGHQEAAAVDKETLSLENGLKVKSFKHRLKFVLPLRK